MTTLDLSAHQYFYDLTGDDRPSLSASLIHRLITKTPAHARAQHPKLNPQLAREDALHFDIGTASHALLLQGDAGVQVIEADSFRGKAAQEERDAARADGKVPLLDKHWQQVQDMVTAIRDQLPGLEVSPPMFTDGKPEQTIVWEDQGVLCRARLDWLHHSHATIDDFKTASDCRPEAWSKGAFFNYGYDIKAAFYMRGVRAVLGVDADFRYLVSEKEPPYAVAAYAPAPDALELANRKIDHALNVWRDCLLRGSWPGYSPRLHFVTLPSWAEAAWFDREAREAVAA